MYIYNPKKILHLPPPIPPGYVWMGPYTSKIAPYIEDDMSSYAEKTKFVLCQKQQILFKDGIWLYATRYH